MEKMLRHLADLREEIEMQKAIIGNLKRRLSETEIGQQLSKEEESINLLNDTAAKTDCAIRSIALDNYHKTQNKKPAAGVAIRIRKDIDYDITEATEWAESDLVKKSFPRLMALDIKAFKKVATGLRDTSFIIPVTFVDNPQVTISKDLSEYIEKEDLHETD